MPNRQFLILASVNIVTVVAAIIGALIAGFFSWLATWQSHNYSLKSDKANRKKQEKAVKSLINESVLQVYNILRAPFGKINDGKSPYGYIIVPHSSSKYIFPLLDDAVKKIGIIEDDLYKKTIIQIYTELKYFLDLNEIYKNGLQELKQYRKENINQTDVWNINLLDYFNLDLVLIDEEKKQDSKINDNFFKYQGVLINNLIDKSNTLEQMHTMLLNKIREFLERYNG